MRAVSSGPALTARRPGIASTNSATFALSALRLAADQDVLVQLGVAVGEVGGADGVERGDDGDAVGHHLLRLLGGGALPDAERASRLARHRRRERHGAVDEELARLERLLQVREVLGLGPERHREHDDRPLLGGLRVRHALDLRVGDGVGELLRRLRRAVRVARAEHHRAAGERPAERQAVAEGAGAADDRDRARA